MIKACGCVGMTDGCLICQDIFRSVPEIPLVFIILASSHRNHRKTSGRTEKNTVRIRLQLCGNDRLYDLIAADINRLAFRARNACQIYR